MNRFASSRLVAAVAAGILLHLPTAAYACTVCTGQGDNTSQMDEAMNGAIFLMLGVLALMLGLITAVGISIVRRAQNPLPAHVQLAENFGTPTPAK